MLQGASVRKRGFDLSERDATDSLNTRDCYELVLRSVLPLFRIPDDAPPHRSPTRASTMCVLCPCGPDNVEFCL